MSVKLRRCISVHRTSGVMLESRCEKLPGGLRRMIAAVVTAEQVRLLQANGVDEFHFYTLNRPELTHAIAHLLGVRAAPEPLPR